MATCKSKLLCAIALVLPTMASASGFYTGESLYQLSISNRAAYDAYIIGNVDRALFMRDFDVDAHHCLPAGITNRQLLSDIDRRFVSTYYSAPALRPVRASRHIDMALVKAYPCDGGINNE